MMENNKLRKSECLSFPFILHSTSFFTSFFLTSFFSMLLILLLYTRLFSFIHFHSFNGEEVWKQASNIDTNIIQASEASSWVLQSHFFTNEFTDNAHQMYTNCCLACNQVVNANDLSLCNMMIKRFVCFEK